MKVDYKILSEMYGITTKASQKMQYGIMPLGTLRYLITKIEGEIRDDIAELVDSDLPDSVTIEISPDFVSVLK